VGSSLAIVALLSLSLYYSHLHKKSYTLEVLPHSRAYSKTNSFLLSAR
jgi:hypothetical protein